MIKHEILSKERLANSIEKAAIHLKRIHFCTEQLRDYFPLSEDIFRELSETQIALVDQLIFRFSKLQDELGSKTFKFLLESLKEDIATKPFKDILNRLEQLGYIENSSQWEELRELRNSLAHEYPTMVQETVDSLNVLFDKVFILEEIYNKILTKAN